MRVGTFLQGAADLKNVSGFRYGCEGLLEGLSRCDAIEQVYAFGLALPPGARERLAARLPGRCVLVPLDGVTDLAALEEAPIQVLHEMEHHLRRALWARAALRRPVPLSLGTHGNRLGAGALFPFYLLLLLGGLGRADRVICASEAARAALLRHLERLRAWLGATLGTDRDFPGRVEVIPYGVDADRFRPQPADAARAALGLRPQVPLLLVHGRIDLRNKQDYAPLLLVVRRLLPAFPDLRLLVSTTDESPGLGLLRLRAAQLGVTDRLDVVQGLPRERVPLLYAACDAALCLSDTPIENFGLTALEAMACGVPVVAADWAGLRDTVRDGETGLLVPTLGSDYEEEIDLLDALDGASAPALAAQSVAADCDALEQALRTLLGDAALARRLGEGGRRRVLERYTLDLVARRHAALWREMAAEAAPGPGPPRVRLGDVVAHYPSRQLRDEEAVALTEDGRALLGAREVICIPPVAGRPIEEAGVAALLRLLAPGPPLPVAELLARAAPRSGLRPPALRRHLLWLLKQGYVRLQEGAQSRSQQRLPSDDSETA